MIALSWDEGQLKPRDVNWRNADVLTPNDLFLSVAFTIRNGEASVFQGRELILTGQTDGWERAPTGGAWIIQMENGEQWEVVKLKCKCTDPKKSGRIWKQ